MTKVEGQAPGAPDTPAKAGSREWLGLVVLCLPTMLTVVDINVMFLALPRVSADLGANAIQLLWISDIYGFMMAGFLITMGTLGDKIGRRRLLLLGAVAFIVASLLAAFATSTAMLIAARALIGIAGATVAPSVLALISTMFKDPKEMGAAMGMWGTSIMLGVILGPVVGGLLLKYFWWGSIFLMAIPVMALLLLAGPSLLPESRNPNPGRLDLVSVGLSLVAILPLIYGLKELARNGWQVAPVVTVLVGVVFLLLFLQRQRRLADPLLDLKLFGIRTLSTALLLAMFFAFVMGGIGLMATLFMQLVMEMSPVQVAMWLLIPSLAMTVAIGVASGIAQKVPPGGVLTAGAVLAAIGMAVISQIDSSSSLTMLVIGLVIVFIGGAAVGPLTPFLIMSSAPADKAGSAGSLQSTAGEFGTALGVAILGLIGTAVYRTQLAVPAGTPTEAAEAAREGIAGAATVARDLPAPVAEKLLASAQDAFGSGLNTVAIIAGVLLLVLAALAATGLRNVPPMSAMQNPAPGAATQDAS